MAKMSASYGYDDAVCAELARFEVLPAYVSLTEPEVIPPRPFGAGGARGSPTLSAAGSMAAVSFPIIYDSEMYGWITVDVTDHPERLDDNGDITERLRGLAGQAAIAMRNARLLDEIRHQALHDSLTGLPNRVLILDRVTQTLARARREHFDVAVLFIDLDGFKDINDTFGHGMGDKLLTGGGRPLRRHACESPTPWPASGGDEFVVVAEGISLAAGPELVAERLLNVLAEPFHLATTQDVGHHLGQHRHRRRAARQRRRALARRRHRPLRRQGQRARTATSSSRPRCRPSCAAATSSRWICRRPSAPTSSSCCTNRSSTFPTCPWSASKPSCAGITPPGACSSPTSSSPPSRASGLIIPVGSLGPPRGLPPGHGVAAKGQVTKMSVNASGRQFDADSLLDDVRRALAASGLPADDLIIEITETSLMRNTKMAQKQLTALKTLGVRIAIDDFGTGYSSLAYLQQFPVDSLKIDRSFISGMAKSPEGDALIHTLMQLGKALHLETLAEGIEESGQLTQLQAESCDVGQGFLFARPLAPDEVEAFFKPAPDPAVV